jgi:hypothetical protein
MVLRLLFDQWLLLVSRAFADAGSEVIIITTIDPMVGDADYEDTPIPGIQRILDVNRHIRSVRLATSVADLCAQPGFCDEKPAQ